MDLKTFATPIAAGDHFVKVSFGGMAGSGKTRTGAEFCVGAYHDMKLKKPLLFLDNEKSSRFLIPFFKQHKVPVLLKETVQLADVLEAFRFLQSREADFLFIDSMTKIYYRYIKDYREKAKITFMQMNDWGKVLPAWQEMFADAFVATAGNIIFTGRGGFKYRQEEEENEQTGKIKKTMVQSGVKMKLAGETPFEPDLNIWMELKEQVTSKGKHEAWREAQVMKDRNITGTSLDGKVFRNPTYKDFQPFVSFILEQPTGAVAGETATESLAPSEDLGWYKRKKDREIEVEKIHAAFEAVALGTSKEDKQIKVIIFERFLGTTSSTEFEKMSAEKLRLARVNIERLFERWGEIDPKDRLPFVRNFLLLSKEPIESDESGLFAGLDEKTPEVQPTNGHSAKFNKLLGEGKAAKTKAQLEKTSRTVAALFGAGELTVDENNELFLVLSTRLESFQGA